MVGANQVAFREIWTRTICIANQSDGDIGEVDKSGVYGECTQDLVDASMQAEPEKVEVALDKSTSITHNIPDCVYIDLDDIESSTQLPIGTDFVNYFWFCERILLPTILIKLINYITWCCVR